MRPSLVAADSPQIAWLKNWTGPLAISVAALAMFCWTWQAWPDVIVDFGRELYVPWRLTEGDILYRDIAYFNGPLSPYFNAALFKCFGASLRVLALANFAMLGLTLALMYGLLSQIGSRAAATIANLFFVAVFAFSLLGYNFNYICPYSHEVTHGLVLSLAALFSLARFERGGRLIDAALCGVCAGLVFLTKPEFFVALLPAVAVGGALIATTQISSRTRRLRAAGLLLGALIAPPLVAGALLSLQLPLQHAARGVLGGFGWVLAPAVTNMTFYQNMRGTNDLGQNALRIAHMSGVYVGLLGLPAIGGLLWRRQRQWQPVAAAAWLFAIVGGMRWYQAEINWAFILVPIPFLMLAALVAFGRERIRAKAAGVGNGQGIVVACVLFALLLTIKVLFRMRVDNYGFVLAVPATMIAIVLAWDWLPRMIEQAGGTGVLLRAALVGTLGSTAWAYLTIENATLQRRTVCVGSGGDAIWWDSRGHVVNETLAQIEAVLPPDGTLAAVPEGAMLNYLSRRRNSTPYISYMPLEVLMFGEQPMLDALAQSPPDIVLSVSRLLDGYGMTVFGEQYGQRLRSWLLANYIPTSSAGAGTAFDIGLLRRREAINKEPTRESEAPGEARNHR